MSAGASRRLAADDFEARADELFAGARGFIGAAQWGSTRDTALAAIHRMRQYVDSYCATWADDVRAAKELGPEQIALELECIEALRRKLHAACDAGRKALLNG